MDREISSICPRKKQMRTRVVLEWRSRSRYMGMMMVRMAGMGCRRATSPAEGGVRGGEEELAPFQRTDR